MQNKKESIGIIGGSGAMGRGLAYRLAKAGYPIIIGSREPTRISEVINDLVNRLPEANISARSICDTAEKASIIALTVPYKSHGEILKLIRPYLVGKLLIDTTVPLMPPKVSQVTLPPMGSAALETLALVGNNTDVIAAFHNVSAHLLNSDNPIDCDVFVTGNSNHARQRVIGLANDMGIKAWHAGPLANSIATEALTSVLIFINKQYGYLGSGIHISNSNSSAYTTYAPHCLDMKALDHLPKIENGSNLPEIIWNGLVANNIALSDGDVLVVAQKIISKSEGQMIRLDSVVPSDEAKLVAKEVDKDARLIQLILDESVHIVRKKTGVIIVKHRLGTVMANAGVDQSNVPEGYALLLPKNPDRSAANLCMYLSERSGKKIAVIISDSIGRAWRNGVVGHAIGVACLDPLLDLRGNLDMYGRPLKVTQVAIADSIASAATLMMGEANELRPVIIIRGYNNISNHIGAQPLIRKQQEDLFL